MVIEESGTAECDDSSSDCGSRKSCYFTVESIRIQKKKNDSPPFSYFGCMAFRDIPKHTLIHQERWMLHGADIWTAKECYENGTHTSQLDEDVYLRDHCGLSDSQREQLWALHDQRHHDDDDDTAASTSGSSRQRRRLLGIIFSNGFCNSDVGCEDEPCLFGGATSRFNHSCRPNLGMDFQFRDIRIFTTRSVAKGEELCLCYNDVVYAHSTQVRRAFLNAKYQFDCQCTACRPPRQHLQQDATASTSSTPFIALTSNNTTSTSDCQRRKMGRLAKYLAAHVDGASFLYNEAFEQGIRQLTQADINNDGGDDDYWDSSTEENHELCRNHKKALHPLDRLLEYMELLHLESVDHDMLQCYELAYDLAIASSRQTLAQEPRSQQASESSSSSSSSSGNESTGSAVTGTKDAADRDPTEWAQKTLSLYQLHKGPHHSATQTFRLKIQSHGIVLS